MQSAKCKSQKSKLGGARAVVILHFAFCIFLETDAWLDGEWL